MKSRKQRILTSVLLPALLLTLAFSTLPVSEAGAGYHPPSEGILGADEEPFTGEIIDRGEDDTPEKEEKPFPWVWVGIGAAAVIVVTAVIVKKRK